MMFSSKVTVTVTKSQSSYVTAKPQTLTINKPVTLTFSLPPNARVTSSTFALGPRVAFDPPRDHGNRTMSARRVTENHGNATAPNKHGPSKLATSSEMFSSSQNTGAQTTKTPPLFLGHRSFVGPRPLNRSALSQAHADKEHSFRASPVTAAGLHVPYGNKESKSAKFGGFKCSPSTSFDVGKSSVGTSASQNGAFVGHVSNCNLQNLAEWC
jgi:hypothetical protein